MLIVKGFLTHNQFINNQPGVISQIGELSAQSATFSIEKGFYKNNAFNDVTLITLSAKDAGVAQSLSLTQANAVIDIGRYVYQMTLSAPTVAQTASAILNSLMTDKSGVASNFSCGAIESDSTYYMPQWLEFTLATGELIHLWFTDGAIASQFDEYILRFAAPFDNLDDFFLAGNIVQTRLAAIAPLDIITKLQAKKGNDPETFIDLKVYSYHDPLDNTRVIATNWGVLGYGPAASNADIQKNELINFIMGNTTHTQEEWTAIFPDIFKKTEFVLAPFWDQYAIEPRETTPGIYSPLVNHALIATRLTALLPTYTSFQIQTYNELMAFPYKSLQIATVGAAENRDSKFKITDYFSDYINVSTTSEDFNRQLQYTRDWVVLIHNLVVLAETATIDTLLPLSISKLQRDNILYLGEVYDNILYLVATKSSIDSL